MGSSFSGPKTQNLMNGYIDRVPQMPEGVCTAEEISRFYEEKHKFT